MKVIDQSTRLTPTPITPMMPAPMPPTWDTPMVLPNLTSAKTNYNPKATKNVKVIFRRKDQENRWRVTEEERGYAQKSKYPKDLQDFIKKVRSPIILLSNKLMIRFKNN
jgi:hypothetical protein